MNDITELAQSLRRRAASANEFGEGLFFIKADDVLALVEALEKAQETIAFQQGEINALLSSLESRTVKLPEVERPIDGTGYANAAGAQYYKERVIKALTAQGIKVEAE
ncbi:TPA: hypothetical protein ACRXX2_003553 [Klebsiella pneumoniae]|nr:hypothetical protein [Klebsiella pneumoniae]